MTGECGAVMHACVVRWCTRGRLPDASNPCGWLSRDGDRLKEHLRQKLIDCGWRDRLKEHTMGACAAFARCYSCLASRNPLWLCLPPWLCLSLAELIRSKGDTTMTVEQLTQEIIPRGRGTTLPSNGVKAATPAIASPRHTIWLPSGLLTAGTEHSVCRRARAQGRCPTKSSRSCSSGYADSQSSSRETAYWCSR